MVAPLPPRNRRGQFTSADMVRQLNGAIIVGTANELTKAVAKSSGQLPTVLQGLGKTLAIRNLRTQDMKATNQRIAEHAQRVMTRGWRSRLPLRGPSYRAGARLTGQLGPALGNTAAMTAKTSDRVISFVNTDHLNREARHWHRVNYGSGTPLQQERDFEPATFNISLYGKHLMTVRDDSPSRPSHYLPVKFGFIGTGRNAIFVPRMGPATPRGPGSRAARFTDIGLSAVVRRFPREYDKLFRAYIQETGQRARLEQKGITVIQDLRLERYGFKVSRSS